MLFEGSNWMEIFDRKRSGVPSAVWPQFQASDELTKIIHESIQPMSQHRTMDLEKISSWSEPIGNLFAND